MAASTRHARGGSVLAGTSNSKRYLGPSNSVTMQKWSWKWKYLCIKTMYLPCLSTSDSVCRISAWNRSSRQRVPRQPCAVLPTGCARRARKNRLRMVCMMSWSASV